MDFSKHEANPGFPGSKDIDFNRSVNQNQLPQNQSANKDFKNNNWKKPTSQNKVLRSMQAILSLCVLIVIIGLLVFLAFNDFNSNNNTESNYVQTNKLQAVFLNTNQVYFGNIKALNNNYLVLTNIFYLRSNSTSNNSNTSSSSSSSSNSSNLSLVKLGCEIDAPLNQMIINRSAVTFWENLSPNGQVAKAVSNWEKQHPNGLQQCSTQSSAAQQSTTSPQKAGNTATPTTSPTTNTTTTGSTPTKK